MVSARLQDGADVFCKLAHVSLSHIPSGLVSTLVAEKPPNVASFGIQAQQEEETSTRLADGYHPRPIREMDSLH